MKAPPPIETTLNFPLIIFKHTFSSIFRKYDSPLSSKISGIVFLHLRSISASVSTKSISKVLDSSLPTDVLPEPIIPIKTNVFDILC